jgi:hypothetical protein
MESPLLKTDKLGLVAVDISLRWNANWDHGGSVLVLVERSLGEHGAISEGS